MTSYETWVKENISPRKALVSAVREQVYPLFKELGFRRGRKPPPGVEPDTFGLGYGRIREGHLDKIAVHWRKYDRPFYVIEFRTSQTERMGPGYDWAHSSPGRIYRSRPPRWRFWQGEPDWFTSGSNLQAEIDIALTRVRELDLYLKTGAPMEHIDLDGPPPIYKTPS